MKRKSILRIEIDSETDDYLEFRSKELGISKHQLMHKILIQKDIPEIRKASKLLVKKLFNRVF